MKNQFKENCPSKYCEGTLLLNVKIDRQLHIEPMAVKCLHCKGLFVVNYRIVVETEIYNIGEKNLNI